MESRTILRTLSLGALLFSVQAFAQTPSPINQQPSPINQQPANAQCNNIVALAGSAIRLDCSHLLPGDIKLITGISEVLNKMVANSVDPDVVMKKLDEIIHPFLPHTSNTSYFKDGSRRIKTAEGSSVDATPNPAFEEITKLYEAQNWIRLAVACDRAIAKSPEWYTPYFYGGLAYSNLAQKQKTLDLLRKAEQGMADNPDYQDLPEQVKRALGTVLGSSQH